MRTFKNPSIYIFLLLVTTLVLAFTTYHFASQNSKVVDSMQQNIDSNFLSSLRQVDKKLNEISSTPSSSELQQLQSVVSQTNALVKYTSYAKKEVYLNSVFGQLNNLILNAPFIPISFTEDIQNEWSRLLNAMIEEPANMQTLNEFVASINRLQNSGS